MATGSILLPILAMVPDDTNPCGLAFNGNRPYLTFDGGATDELAYITFRVPADYSSAPVLKVVWGAASATSGNVVWGCDVMAITPETDSADVATDSYATANTQQDAHLGTTAGRAHLATITLTNFDSGAAGDYLAFKFYRDASDTVNDTLSGDAYLHALTFEYTTT